MALQILVGYGPDDCSPVEPMSPCMVGPKVCGNPVVHKHGRDPLCAPPKDIHVRTKPRLRPSLSAPKRDTAKKINSAPDRFRRLQKFHVKQR